MCAPENFFSSRFEYKLNFLHVSRTVCSPSPFDWKISVRRFGSLSSVCVLGFTYRFDETNEHAKNRHKPVLRRVHAMFRCILQIISLQNIIIAMYQSSRILPVFRLIISSRACFFFLSFLFFCCSSFVHEVSLFNLLVGLRSNFKINCSNARNFFWNTSANEFYLTFSFERSFQHEIKAHFDSDSRKRFREDVLPFLCDNFLKGFLILCILKVVWRGFCNSLNGFHEHSEDAKKQPTWKRICLNGTLIEWWLLVLLNMPIVVIVVM